MINYKSYTRHQLKKAAHLILSHRLNLGRNGGVWWWCHDLLNPCRVNDGNFIFKNRMIYIVIAFDEDKPIGTGILLSRPSRLAINTGFFVRNAYRDQGIGRKLWEYVHHQANIKKIKMCWSWVPADVRHRCA